MASGYFAKATRSASAVPLALTNTERVSPIGNLNETRCIRLCMCVTWRLLSLAMSSPLPHLADEDPDQPETACDQRHEAVPDEMEESVPLLLLHIDEHNHLLRKKKRRAPACLERLLWFPE